ncbi:MAG: glycosyltransferase family 1 protein [Acidobacteria bacterium]|nr:MAG: glycosyltransferase family 1 protein [Acidobacteriota bacterium]
MERPLSIAFVVGALEVGGLETVVLSLGAHLQAVGHQVTIVTCVRRGQWWDLATAAGLSCVCLPLAKSFCGVRHSRVVGRYLAGHAFDCIVLNDCRYAQASLGMLSEKTIAMPIIHNNQNDVYATACANPDAWNVAIGVSPKVTQVAQGRVPGKVVRTVLNGVSAPTPEAFGRRMRLAGKMALLFVGRVSHRDKGALYLAEIVRKCVARGIDCELTIVGAGESLEDVQRRAKQFGLGERVRAVGVLSRDGVYEEMLKHHVLVMPSHYEGLGLVALEAQACGCVPVASRLQGITDHALVDGETGTLVDVGDVEGFAEAIERLYRDRKLWRTMSERGHSRVESEASVEVMGAAYEQIIGEALQGRYPLPKGRRSLPKCDRRVLTWREYVPRPLLGYGRALLRRARRGREAGAPRAYGPW